MVCSTRALFILWNRCFPQSSRRWQLLLLTLSLSLLLFFPHFLLSDIFAGEYFLLIFSCLPLYLFSTSSFDLGCACVLFIFWVKLTLIWSRFLMFYLLAEGGTSGFEYKFLYFVQYPVKEQVLETILFCLKKLFRSLHLSVGYAHAVPDELHQWKKTFFFLSFFFSQFWKNSYVSKLWSDFFSFFIDQNAIFVWGLMWCLCVLERVSPLQILRTFKHTWTVE